MFRKYDVRIGLEFLNLYADNTLQIITALAILLFASKYHDMQKKS